MIRWIFTGNPLTLHNLPTRVLTRGTWLRADPPWKLCQSHLMQAGLSSMVVAVWTENKTHFFSKVEPVSFCIQTLWLVINVGTCNFTHLVMNSTPMFALWFHLQCHWLKEPETQSTLLTHLTVFPNQMFVHFWCNFKNSEGFCDMRQGEIESPLLL